MRDRCLRLPTRLKMNPAGRVPCRNVEYPLITAWTDPDIPLGSTTRITGAERSSATWAVLPTGPPSTPSKSPITPSMMARSAPSDALAKTDTTSPSPIMKGSRFLEIRPQMAVWWEGSMKSGPTLKGWTVSPRAAKAAMSPRATVVFPHPLQVPPITILGKARFTSSPPLSPVSELLIPP
jgi:hypothetical protein